MSAIENLNVTAQELLLTPTELKQALPLTEELARHVSANRQKISEVLQRQNPALMVVVGPCSIHDRDAALEYAGRLAALQRQVHGSMLLVMRAYFEKPRTTTGWKGMINDPHLDDTFAIADGLRIARALLLDICALGLPIATEALDPITPQYLQDLISWSAIGARTAESQTHREMASGLSSAVGFKNGTDGSLSVAINALKSVASPHRFLGINQGGQVSIIHTSGNALAHVVLRGGTQGPNYAPEFVEECEAALEMLSIEPNIMIDCSHANSEKQHERQLQVARSIADQIESGNRSIIGCMLESHLHAGNQPLELGSLRYGVSITDACLDWQDTEAILLELHERLERPLRDRLQPGTGAQAAEG